MKCFRLDVTQTSRNTEKKQRQQFRCDGILSVAYIIDYWKRPKDRQKKNVDSHSLRHQFVHQFNFTLLFLIFRWCCPFIWIDSNVYCIDCDISMIFRFVCGFRRTGSLFWAFNACLLIELWMINYYVWSLIDKHLSFGTESINFVYTSNANRYKYKAKKNPKQKTFPTHIIPENHNHNRARKSTHT